MHSGWFCLRSEAVALVKLLLPFSYIGLHRLVALHRGTSTFVCYISRHAIIRHVLVSEAITRVRVRTQADCVVGVEQDDAPIAVG